MEVVHRRSGPACRQGLLQLQVQQRLLARRPTHLIATRRALSFTTPRRYTQGSDQRPRPTSSQKPGFQWIPVGVGVGFLGLFQLYRIQRRERHSQSERQSEDAEGGLEDGGGKRKKRPRVRPEGPWQVQVMSTLPLKALSRVWGRFNELTIPYYLRIPGFRLYSWIFGVNLDEVAEPDLRVYPNLAAFFYRELKPGLRPLDPNPNALLSPADGRVLQFGRIEAGGSIEQVKGVTYSIDALLGKTTSPASSRRGSTASSSDSSSSPPPSSPTPSSSSSLSDADDTAGHELAQTDEEFARVNGISYTLPGLLSGGPGDAEAGAQAAQVSDQSVPASPGAVSEVGAELALGDRPWYSLLSAETTRTALYYAVVYLAPGDYHRFHSPASWVASTRRHFAGELYSVSPYLQRMLPGLFTLNERVVLLGRWRHGFCAFVAVGATNVGSIVVNFDRELRTNSLTTDTAADRAAEEARARGEAHAGFAEATYEGASALLAGRAIRRGEEMGGFRLGSTIVLVFEAPAGADETEGGAAEQGGRGFRWAVDKGQRVRVGQALGYVQE